MTASIKAFGSGVSESFDALIDNAVIIGVGTASSAAVGFLVGGAPMAWMAAKVTSLVLGAVFAMESSIFTGGLNSLTHRTAHSAGNVVASLWIPFFSVLALQKIIH